MLFVARSFWFWGRVPFAVRCFLLLFVARFCFSVLKKQNRQMPLAAPFGFLLLVLVFYRCFHLNIAFLVLLFVGTKNQNEQQKAQKVEMETMSYSYRAQCDDISFSNCSKELSFASFFCMAV